ncbi:MAG: 2Fe-2S iron-sulfur cluster-binding protein, partial [Anaerolineales bacterium]|nr:2Fe-2S iron-sulfur cluster-binding protein [Anaerolineales bacterium]
MSEHLVTFDVGRGPVKVPTGTLLSEAARLAGVEITQPCGGQGRCGRCTVQVVEGTVRRRSTLRLSQADVENGYALACQSVIESDVSVVVPPQEKIERRLTTDRTVAEITVPFGYNPFRSQTVQRVHLSMLPPSLDDQMDDLSRLRLALRQQAGFTNVNLSLMMLRQIGQVLRESDWEVTALLDVQEVLGGGGLQEYLIALLPGHIPPATPMWGIAVDIGTTTATVWLVD